MFAVAEKTGWSEKFLTWELPLTRLMAYEHCALAMNPGIWTIKREKAESYADKPILPAGFFDDADDEE